MATFVNDLRLTELATGEGSGTWGDTTNTNLELISSAMGHGAEAIANASTHTITMADGADDEFRSTFLRLTGGGQACTVTLAPNTLSHTWIMRNETNSTLTLTQGTGANVAISAGQTKIVATDGAGSGAVVYELDDLELAGNLAVGGNVTITGDIDVDGTIEFDALSGTGSVAVTDIADEDNMSSNSATKLATQQSIKAYVDSQVGTVDTLAEILANGNTTGSTDIEVTSAQKVQFRDSAIYINSSTDGQLDIVADTEIQIAATTIDINGAINASGEIIAASLDISGDIDVDGTTNLDVVDIDGAVDMASTLTVATKVFTPLTGSATDTDTNIHFPDSNQIRFINGGIETFRTLSTGAVFNDGSEDIDFRVESNGNTHMLFIDGGNDAAFFGGSDKRGFVNIETTAVNYSSGVFNNPHIALQASVQPDDNDGFVGITFATSDSDNFGWSAGAERTSSGVGDFVFTQHTNSATGSEKLRLLQSGAATFAGAITANAGVAIDNITIDGTEIDLSSGDLTIDVAGDIILDAAGGDFNYKINGTEILRISNASLNTEFFQVQSDSDIKFKGNDGGSTITALTLDMSQAGSATFGGNLTVEGADVTITANIKHAGDTDTFFGFHADNQFRVVTGGSERIEVSNSGIIINDSSENADFRVESNNNEHMLFVDGGTDSVSVGTSATDAALNVNSGSNSKDAIRIVGSGGNNFIAGYGNQGSLSFSISETGADDPSVFKLFRNGTESVRITSDDADATIFNNQGDNIDFRVASDSNTHALFVDADNNQIGIGTSGVTSSFLLGVQGKTTLGDRANSQSNGGFHTELSGTSLTDGSGFFGSYGTLNFFANSTYTSTARRWQLTNAFETNKFALICGDTDSSSQPELSGTGGTLANGFAVLAFDNTGTATFEHGVIINESSRDVDFRVESNGQTHMLFVDGGNDVVTFGTSTATLFSNNSDVYGASIDADGLLQISRNNGSMLYLNRQNANGEMIDLRVNGGQIGSIGSSSESLFIKSTFLDRDIIFKGNDGGTEVTALTLDMSASGAATFNSNISAQDISGGIITASSSSDYPLRVNSTDAFSGIVIADNTSTTNGNVISVTGDTMNFFTGGTSSSTDIALTLASNNNATFTGSITASGGQIKNANNANASSHNFLVETTNKDNALYAYGADRNGTMYGIKLDGGVVAENLMTRSSGTSNLRLGNNAGQNIASGGNYNTVVGDNAGNNINTGDNNTFVGFASGDAVTTGTESVAFGSNALSASVGADKNTALGAYALRNDTEGESSVAVGHQALNAQNFSSATSAYNVAVGANAGVSVTTGLNNTIIGGLAGDALTDADSNLAIGQGALSADTLGSHSVALGHQALNTQNFSSATNSYNVAVGSQAGHDITTGVQNTIIGGLAADNLTTGNYNVAIGKSALDAETAGHQSIAIGLQALASQNNSSSTNAFNVAIGSQAGLSVTTGLNNTIIGGLAGDALTDADFNVAVGQGALSSDSLGSRSVAIGTNALTVQNFTSATNTHNTAVGQNAGGSVTTGVENTIIGALAGDALTDADLNVALGYAALGGDTLGSRSVAIGHGALSNQNFTSATNSNNTAVGFSAGEGVTTGTQNTLIGSGAGDEMTTGTANTFIGSTAAGTGVVTGDSNTAVGKSAGLNITSGGNNLCLGHDAGIGGSPGGNVTNQSNIIFLGDENIVTANIQVALTVASDERDKTDFADLDVGLDFVKQLKPYTYKWDKRSKYGDKYADDYDLNAQTPDGTHKEDWLDIGFKAQEVEALEKAAGYDKANKTNLAVKLSEDGNQYGMQYEKLIPILTKAIQEQQAIIESLTTRITALEGE